MTVRGLQSRWDNADHVGGFKLMPRLIAPAYDSDGEELKIEEGARVRKVADSAARFTV